jgi:hypothetical protein
MQVQTEADCSCEDFLFFLVVVISSPFFVLFRVSTLSQK